MYKIFFFAILFSVVSCRKDEIKILSFKDCKIKYPSYKSGEKKIFAGHSITNDWEFESANRELALYLCEKYLVKPDKEIKDKILKIYNTNEVYYKRTF